MLAALALIAVAALHFLSVPRTIWEYDESLFAYAVERYEPLLHRPPPPGYPLYIGFAKLMPAGASFHALLATSIIGLLTGLVAWWMAFGVILSRHGRRRLLAKPRARCTTFAGHDECNDIVDVIRSPAEGEGPSRTQRRRSFGVFAPQDDMGALVATILLYSSPALLMSGTLPQSDSGALALFGFAAWTCARMLRVENESRTAAIAAILCAATIGWRLQMSIAIVPMFLTAVLLLKSWRARLMAVSVFGVACLSWFVPLVLAAGGPESYWKWLSGQAAYYAAHDADLSRSGQSASFIALRFIAHPWGPKLLSMPLLVFAMVGVILMLVERRSPTDRDDRRGHRAAAPLLAGCLVYLGFALWSMDPADAVRYAIPSLPVVALLAAMGLKRAPLLAIFAVTSVYVAGAYWYTSPVLRMRTTTPAPPTAAANWIAANVPRDAVVLFDMPLGPHASYLLRDYKTMRIDAGLAQYGGTSTPLVLYADGERGRAQGVTFRWPDIDAYRKLTRQHYGAVSVIPLPLSQRFRVIEGVHAPERRRDGTSWRWIGARGVLELPQRGAPQVRVVLRTPPEYPLESNRVRVNDAAIEIRRNQSVEVLVPFAEHIVIAPEQTFVPARIRGANNRDARTLSVMLTSVEQLGGPQRAE